MAQVKKITPATEASVWEEIGSQLKKEMGIQLYEVWLEELNQKVLLKLDVDPGGGFESGYELTVLYAPVSNPSGFRFVLHPEDFLDEVGKFFGMQDVVVGHPEFDDKVLVKTNDEERIKTILSDSATRRYIDSLPSYKLHLHPAKEDQESYLQLDFDEAITDITKLKAIYQGFVHLLQQVK